MKLAQLQKKVKIISNAKGKPIEVVVPYTAYQEYLAMKISSEFYQDSDTQESIKRAGEDIASSRFRDYEDVDTLIKDLHE